MVYLSGDKYNKNIDIGDICSERDHLSLIHLIDIKLV